MMQQIKLEVVTSTGVLISKDCNSVSLPSKEGIIQIMCGCEPTLIELKKGEIVVDGEDNKRFKVILGFAIVDFNSCKVIINEM